MNNSYTKQLIARYNQPDHAGSQQAAQIINNESDPVKAWQELVVQGVLSSNGRRRFSESSEGSDYWPSDRPPESSTPLTKQSVLAFAADISGKLKAEDCAMEFARRLEPWGAVCDSQIVWYFTDNTYEVTYFKKPYNSAWDSVALSIPKIGVEIDSLMPTEDSLPILVRRALVAWEGWELAVQHDLPLQEPKWIDLQQWPRFADLPNPFEPLLELWCTGYRIISAFTSDDPTIRLYTK